jgi:hypothetical protein
VRVELSHAYSQFSHSCTPRSRSLLVERIASGVPWPTQSQGLASHSINEQTLNIVPVPVGSATSCPKVFGLITTVQFPARNRIPG